KALAGHLDFEVPPAFTSTHADEAFNAARKVVSEQAAERLAIQAAGLNHFTWMLALHDRETGEDLYPRFRERWAELPEEFEPLTRRLFQIFDLFPLPGDEHLCEYLPWVSDPRTKPWEKFDLSLYDWDRRAEMRDEGYEVIARMVAGEHSVDALRLVDSEGALEMIASVAGAGSHYHLAVNLPNEGFISNLPAGAIVEVPGVVTGAGVQGVVVGPLPEPIAELCRREITVAQLGIDAAVLGDRQAALQCLLLDPVITDLDVAQNVLEDYLVTYRDLLPQFGA
ncbi:MAG: hypothetical protein ACLFU8_11995, partial [Anaerolineales bacterium]